MGSFLSPCGVEVVAFVGSLLAPCVVWIWWGSLGSVLPLRGFSRALRQPSNIFQAGSLEPLQKFSTIFPELFRGSPEAVLSLCRGSPEPSLVWYRAVFIWFPRHFSGCGGGGILQVPSSPVPSGGGRFRLVPSFPLSPCGGGGVRWFPFFPPALCGEGWCPCVPLSVLFLSLSLKKQRQRGQATNQPASPPAHQPRCAFGLVGWFAGY